MTSSRFKNTRRKYDIVIVGGGIYGASLAWEASSRGLSCLLLEKNDFGSGTSANSLKIVHGGLRYIQDFDFPRMRQSINERKALLRIAPHLIAPLECVIPTYKQLTKSKAALFTGLTLHALFSFDKNRGLDGPKKIENGRILSRYELFQSIPLITDCNITGGARWYDAQAFNTERLVLSFVKSAQNRGAETYNHACARNYLNRGNSIEGVVIDDRITGETAQVLSKSVVECIGPWHPLGFNDNKCFVKSVNIIVRKRLADCAIGVRPKVNSNSESENRLLFLTPWREGSIAGTWYFINNESPDKIRLTKDELMLCLSQLNSIFARINFAAEDVSHIHLGLLPSEQKNNGNGISVKKHCSIENLGKNAGPNHLYRVQGVKFTTARCVSKRVIDKIARCEKIKCSPSKTHVTPLYGGDIKNLDHYLSTITRRYSTMLANKVLVRLVRNYGTKIDHIMNMVSSDPSLGELIPKTKESIKAEVYFAAENEMVYTLSDLLLRRTDIGTFGMPERETTEFCADALARIIGWDSVKRKQNIAEFFGHYDNIPAD